MIHNTLLFAECHRAVCPRIGLWLSIIWDDRLVNPCGRMLWGLLWSLGCKPTSVQQIILKATHPSPKLIIKLASIIQIHQASCHASFLANYNRYMPAWQLSVWTPGREDWTYKVAYRAYGRLPANLKFEDVVWRVMLLRLPWRESDWWSWHCTTCHVVGLSWWLAEYYPCSTVEKTASQSACAAAFPIVVTASFLWQLPLPHLVLTSWVRTSARCSQEAGPVGRLVLCQRRALVPRAGDTDHGHSDWSHVDLQKIQVSIFGLNFKEQANESQEHFEHVLTACL